MKNYIIYFLFVLIFCISLANNVSAQSRTSASVDIRIKIVNSVTTSFVQNGILSEVDSKNNKVFEPDREVLVLYGNRAAQEKVNKLENKLKSNKLDVFNRFNDRIGTAEIHNFTTLQNISKTDKLQFLPSSSQKHEEYNFEPSVTIVY